MTKKVFDYDPLTGITTYWHVKGNGEYVVEKVQDVSKLADWNRRQYNDTPKKHGDLNKVASIPLSVYYELKRQGIADDPVALKKWLNDSNNQVFRTRASVL